MSSEIKVDTISENTSANGVVIDSVTLKDGAIGAAGTVTSIAGANILVEANSLFIGDDVSGTTDTAANSVAVGIDALDAVTTGDANVAIGKSALSGNTTGGNNIAIGNQALNAPDTESSNIAIGSNSLNGSVAGGEYNVAIGVTAGNALTSADYVTAVGNAAGSAITTGGKHVLIGHNAGSGLTTSAGSCIYIGTGAGSGASNDVETFNIGIGEDTVGGAGNTINGAEFNVAIGHRTCEDLTTGDHNTAIGYIAFANGTTGYQNTLIGSQAGDVLTSGDDNVIIGFSAAAGHTGGDQQTVIGSGCAASGTGHQIVMGHQNGSAGNNYVTLGQGSGGDKIYAQYTSSATWTKASDERIKKDIVTNTEIGLDFINELRTVKFKKKNHSEVDANLAIYDASDTDARDATHYGLIAQEVKAAMDKHSIAEFQGWHKLSKEVSPDEIQGVSEQMFVYPLIKAVQELAAKVKALEEA